VDPERSDRALVHRTQREIELAVRKPLEAGASRGDETVRATATVTVRGLSQHVAVTGTIALS
jgi:hypothetical protein